jgi:YegS/Rv2252/BmrU family lipid kinase
MASRRALIIRNPASRRQLKPAQLEAAVGILRAAGWDTTISVTEHAGHATDVAREAAAQLIDVVVVNGGDGTINEALQGLAGTDTALAVLPGGTANVWAKEARIPKDAAKAMRIVLDGERRRIDLGVANGRHFLLMAGVGLDAAIIPRVNPRLKRRAGALAYILAGITTAVRTKPWDTSIAITPGEEIDAPNLAMITTPLYWMLAGNTRNYGGLLDITHRARVDDALLDIALMRRGGWRLIPDGIRVLLRRHDRSPNVLYTQSPQVAIDTPGIPVQLDGEYCMDTPLLLTAAPQSLTVILPKGKRGKVFGTAVPHPASNI